MKLDPFFFLFCNLNVMQNHSSFFSVNSAKLSAIQVQYNSIDHHDEFRKTFNFHVALPKVNIRTSWNGSYSYIHDIHPYNQFYNYSPTLKITWCINLLDNDDYDS